MSDLAGPADAAPKPRVPHVGATILALSVIAIAIFTIRLTGLPDLVDNEYRLGASVLNAWQGGNWVVPHDAFGNTDKPPMLTWLSALVTAAVGRVNAFTLYLPTAVATLAIALLVFAAGRRYFDERTGLFGALTYLLSNVVSQQMATARWDGLFALTVTLIALAAFHAWTSGRGWTLFWLAAAISTLTKGPLGLVLGAFGLLAVRWERRSGHAHPLRGSHALGIVLFVVIVGGWSLAAYHRAGSHLVDNMVRSELVRHAVMGAPGHRFRKPPSDFVANFAPWSLLTLLGIWRIWSTSSPDDTARRFERFCFCWFVGGLLLFAISPHNPARLLYPIIPPAAIIAGREVARFARTATSRTVIAGCALATTIALTCFIVKYHYIDRRRQHVRKTQALLDLHAQVHERAGDDFPLTYVSDVPFALQLTFNTMRPTVTWQQAAALLRDDAPVYVVVHDLTRLRRQMGSERPALYEVAACSLGSTRYVTIVSNRPALEWSDPIAMGLGPLRLRLRGVRVGPTQDGRIVLQRSDDSGSASVANGASEPTAVVVDLTGHGLPSRQMRRLAAGETWLVSSR